ncbi:MAG: HAD-IC family P-type ATPase [Christensenellaceae bacterium]
MEERTEQGLVNRAQKKFSKTYRSIFVGNICTFFNLLCLLAALALLSAHAPISQFTFVLIFLCNISVGIFQEIRAKKKIDKLSILSSPTAKVVRSSKKKEIPISELVLDDILLLGAGQQVPADCIMLDGTAELNESLLTGESVPVKRKTAKRCTQARLSPADTTPCVDKMAGTPISANSPPAPKNTNGRIRKS